MEKIIIVGATSGIGEGLARRYAAQGKTRIGITGRRKERLEALAATHPDKFEWAPCDLTATDSDILYKVLDSLTERLGGLDLLILCAGTGELNPQLEYGLERPALMTNVVGWTCVTDWAVRWFLTQGRGHLAAITSVGGLRGNGTAPAYNATKAFQINYLEGMRLRTANYPDIHITDIRPGFVDTDMAKGEGLFWVAPVDKACRQIIRAIACRRRIAYVTRRWRYAALLWRFIPERLLAPRK